MTPGQIQQFLLALTSLGAEVVGYAQTRGDDPIESIEKLRIMLRHGVTVSVQAELDARFPYPETDSSNLKGKG